MTRKAPIQSRLEREKKKIYIYIFRVASIRTQVDKRERDMLRGAVMNTTTGEDTVSLPDYLWYGKLILSNTD